MDAATGLDFLQNSPQFQQLRELVIFIIFFYALFKMYFNFFFVIMGNCIQFRLGKSFYINFKFHLIFKKVEKLSILTSVIPFFNLLVF